MGFLQRQVDKLPKARAGPILFGSMIVGALTVMVAVNYEKDTTRLRAFNGVVRDMERIRAKIERGEV
ncbi:hypothetical protein Pmar_PMAR020235 [Perkinsus marinus ATCC 50983]|nr:hypothetical protein Pmar_PMAR020235 [Perkinsus marinus ATCC 50983]EEQ99778.1 hypothetical protein Pmar_PMAR020235 [Perkinsus marinus ATCC 50983]|eukprot:XP_002767061.1 hypothetical protein Pmar_PMAR020235 [Perkinsus marinus ATCC 50983]